ncbi:uncharacterized protein LOC127754267 [Oryza glaberrima]|uniref:Uncharacterized protein n=2 Tax=Oryza TaxID=4527 RepID=A0A0D3HM26_9ORYZ|nr:uncharacterized protein LOC127754267 [Oryza glaberrima]
MLDGEKAILEQKIAAATARMNELRRANREMEVKLVIYDAIAGRCKNLDDLSPNFIDDLQKKVAKRHEEVQKRMQELCSMDSSKPT